MNLLAAKGGSSTEGSSVLTKKGEENVVGIPFTRDTLPILARSRGVLKIVWVKGRRKVLPRRDRKRKTPLVRRFEKKSWCNQTQRSKHNIRREGCGTVRNLPRGLRGELRRNMQELRAFVAETRNTKGALIRGHEDRSASNHSLGTCPGKALGRQRYFHEKRETPLKVSRSVQRNRAFHHNKQRKWAGWKTRKSRTCYERRDLERIALADSRQCVVEIARARCVGSHRATGEHHERNPE